MYNNNDRVDSHGEINILSELDWSDVRLENIKKEPIIVGLNLNSLLKGIFIIYSYDKSYCNLLPGGIRCWEDMMEAMFISLTTIANVSDVMKRVQFIVVMYIRSYSNDNNTFNDINYNSEYLSNIVYGSFTFVLHWVTCFHYYLTDMDLICINNGIHSMRRDVISLQSIANISVDNIKAACKICINKYNVLVNEVNSVVRIRTQSALGINSSPSSATGSHHKSFASYVSPAVPVAVGEWSGHEAAAKKEQMMESLTKARVVAGGGNGGPQLKLEIFGGDLLLGDMDDSSDEDDEPMTGSSSDLNHNNNALWKNPEPPIPRIPPGSSLLMNPLAVAMGTSLFNIDTQELARQFTLADHVLFCSIPLSSLIPRVQPSVGAIVLAQQISSNGSVADGSVTSGFSSAAPETNNDSDSATSGKVPHSTLSAKTSRSVTSHNDLPRYQQIRYGSGDGCGIFNCAVRGFIDRFNALSSWVAFSILRDPFVNTRSQRVSFFIKLASCLLELSNYNGVMVILTALQLGCISRLKRTMELLPKSDKLKLAHMQKLMAGGKNYQAYRQELKKLEVHFDVDNAVQDTNVDGELAWRRDIHQESRNSSVSGSRTAVVRRTSATYTNEEKFEALVPHLGAHLAELTSAQEGNGDFLSDSPHLLNVKKFKIMSATLSTLHKMQRLQYNLVPVRLVVAALNATAQQHLRLVNADATAYSKKLFSLSEKSEPTYPSTDDVIVSASSGVLKHSKSMRQPDSHTNKVSFDSDANIRRFASENKISGSTSSRSNEVGEASSGRTKYRKSDAYERIRGMQRNSSFNEISNSGNTDTGSANSDGSDREEADNRSGDKQKKFRPMKLLRNISRSLKRN